MAARSPTRMTEAPNSLTAATAPATTTAGPWSPPIASTAIFIRAGWPFALAIFMAGGGGGGLTPSPGANSPPPYVAHRQQHQSGMLHILRRLITQRIRL